MVYTAAKKLIQNEMDKFNRGMTTEADFQTWKADMEHKLDIFFLMKRITQAQYEELVGLLNPSTESE